MQHVADMAAAVQTIAIECDALDLQKTAVTSAIADARATIHAAVDARFDVLSQEASKLFHDKSKQLSIQGDTLTVIKVHFFCVLQNSFSISPTTRPITISARP
jgi:hypothetical protein